jgi:hypothetical protein
MYSRLTTSAHASSTPASASSSFFQQSSVQIIRNLKAPAKKKKPTSNHIGIVGTGASGIYLLHHLLKDIQTNGALSDLKLSVFEKGPALGVSMPYDPRMVDKVHVVNILSEEVPELICTFADWLRNRSDQELQELGIEDRKQISDTGIYSRIAMNSYLHSQYGEIIEKLKQHGVSVEQHKDCLVADAVDNPDQDTVKIICADGESVEVNRMIIATGHTWPAPELAEDHHFRSPWPIHKLLPKKSEKYNFPIGLLGASLSAFDVVASLADRHGCFAREGKELKYIPDPGTENFHLVLHTSQGKLPHIRCAFQWPYVMQHRFHSIEEIEQAKEEGGILRIETYFQKFCKSHMVDALRQDGLNELAERLDQPDATFASFIDMMNAARRYDNPFNGMRSELDEAFKSIETDTPIYWKETLDDLMYTLNFHSPSFPAEDLQFYQKTVMPFLIYLIAFIPPDSAEKLLAIHQAGKVSIAKGTVKVLENSQDPSHVHISRTDGEGVAKFETYRMFIDCSGQKAVSIGEFPFRTLVQQGVVRAARMPFISEEVARQHQSRFPKEVMKTAEGAYQYLPGGLEIDNAFHVISLDGSPHPRVYDLTYAHLKGQQPFSPGLQQCSDTGEVLAKEMLSGFRQAAEVKEQPRMRREAAAASDNYSRSTYKAGSSLVAHSAIRAKKLSAEDPSAKLSNSTYGNWLKQ